MHIADVKSESNVAEGYFHLTRNNKNDSLMSK